MPGISCHVIFMLLTIPSNLRSPNMDNDSRGIDRGKCACGEFQEDFPAVILPGMNIVFIAMIAQRCKKIFAHCKKK